MHKFFKATLVVGGMLTAASASATTIDLTSAGAVGAGTGVIGGTFYVAQVDAASTGSGIIDPFIRIQHTGNEQAYNTALSTPMDAMSGATALLISDLTSVTLSDSKTYYQFLLDLNESSGQSDELITLNQIQVFLSSADRDDGTASPASATTTPVLSFPAGPTTTTEVFRLNAATYPGAPPGTSIELDYKLNHGSGSGDMLLFLSTDLFQGTYSNVILYTQFGTPPGPNGSEAGFEEWATFTKLLVDPCESTQITCGGGTGTDPLSPVPEPASMFLLGSGLLGVGIRYRRRK